MPTPEWRLPGDDATGSEVSISLNDVTEEQVEEFTRRANDYRTRELGIMPGEQMPPDLWPDCRVRLQEIRDQIVRGRLRH